MLLTCSAILSTVRPSILAKNCNAPLAITVITCIRKSSCYFHEPCTRRSRGYGTSMRVVTGTLLVVPLVVSNLEWVCRELSFRFREVCLDLFRTFMPNNVWHCLFRLTYVAPFCCQIMDVVLNLIVLSCSTRWSPSCELAKRTKRLNMVLLCLASGVYLCQPSKDGGELQARILETVCLCSLSGTRGRQGVGPMCQVGKRRFRGQTKHNRKCWRPELPNINELLAETMQLQCNSEATLCLFFKPCHVIARTGVS